MIRVCLVEDQTLVREGLESLLHLTNDIRVVAHADDGIKALEEVRKSQPDVVLLDLRMPRLDGLAFMRQKAQLGLSSPVIILTTFDDDISVLEGLRLGAKGYLLKDVTFAKLTEAVRTVASGGTLIRACSHYLSASTMRAKLRKPMKSTSSFSNLEKILRKPLSLRNSRSISLRFL